MAAVLSAHRERVEYFPLLLPISGPGSGAGLVIFQADDCFSNFLMYLSLFAAWNAGLCWFQC